MVDLEIAQKSIQQALYNIANLDSLFKQLQKALHVLSEEKREEALYLIHSHQTNNTVIQTIENLSYELADRTSQIFEETVVIFKSISKNHLNDNERIEFNFLDRAQDMTRDALESKSKIFKQLISQEKAI